MSRTNPFASGMIHGHRKLQVGQPFFVIGDVRTVYRYEYDYRSAVFSYVQDFKHPGKTTEILSGVGQVDSDRTYAVLKRLGYIG